MAFGAPHFNIVQEGQSLKNTMAPEAENGKAHVAEVDAAVRVFTALADKYEKAPDKDGKARDPIPAFSEILLKPLRCKAALRFWDFFLGDTHGHRYEVDVPEWHTGGPKLPQPGFFAFAGPEPKEDGGPNYGGKRNAGGFESGTLEPLTEAEWQQHFGRVGSSSLCVSLVSGKRAHSHGYTCAIDVDGDADDADLARRRKCAIYEAAIRRGLQHKQLTVVRSGSGTGYHLWFRHSQNFSGSATFFGFMNDIMTAAAEAEPDLGIVRKKGIVEFFPESNGSGRIAVPGARKSAILLDNTEVEDVFFDDAESVPHELTLGPKPSATAATPTEEDVETSDDLIDAYLKSVDVDDRTEWINSGIFLKSALGEKGYEVWKQVSRTEAYAQEIDTNEGKGNDKDLKKRWNGLGLIDAGKARAVIAARAKKQGWKGAPGRKPGKQIPVDAFDVARSHAAIYIRPTGTAQWAPVRSAAAGNMIYGVNGGPTSDKQRDDFYQAIQFKALSLPVLVERRRYAVGSGSTVYFNEGNRIFRIAGGEITPDVTPPGDVLLVGSRPYPAEIEFKEDWAEILKEWYEDGTYSKSGGTKLHEALVKTAAEVNAVLHPDTTQAIIFDFGPPGSAKTEMAYERAEAFDYSGAAALPSISVKAKPRDVYMQAAERAIFAFDNLGRIDETWSDFMGAIATGGVFSEAKHYEQGSTFKIQVRLPQVYTVWKITGGREDFFQRVFTLHYEQANSNKEDVFLDEDMVAERRKAGIGQRVGAFLQLVAYCQTRVDAIAKECNFKAPIRQSRMYYTFLAVAEAFGWERKTAREWILHVKARSEVEAIRNRPVAKFIVGNLKKRVQDGPQEWEASDLYKQFWYYGIDELKIDKGYMIKSPDAMVKEMQKPAYGHILKENGLLLAVEGDRIRLEAVELQRELQVEDEVPF